MKRHCLLALSVIVLAGLSGCSDDDLTCASWGNKPPTVRLTVAPPEGSVGHYEVRIGWDGEDPDGEIAYFEFVIANNNGSFDPADTTGADKWHKTFRRDSLFVFTADLPADSSEIDPEDLEPVEFRRSHTFFVRAVDMRGMRSARPAYRSFTARTLSPIVDVTVPANTGRYPARVPPITTFRWVGEDYIGELTETQDPAAVRWILLSTVPFGESSDDALQYIRDNPDAPEWSEWRDYDAPDGSGTSWATPPLDFGTYVFAVQVVDEAGAVSPVFDWARNVRPILVTESGWPLLTVFNKYIGTIMTTGVDGPPCIIDIPALVPMEFLLSADASRYGGTISGYRYGWDIDDLNEDSQWDIGWTPFIGEDNTARTPPRAFAFDSHTLHIEVIDNSGFKSRAGIRVNIVPFTMTRSLLVVDDWEEHSPGFARTNGGLPNDTEHDEFWEEILADIDDFDPVVDMIEAGDMLPLEALADYKSIIWVATAAYNSTTGSLINDIIRFIDPDAPPWGPKTSPNIISLYMAAGGHVLLCGEQIMTASINRHSFLPNNVAFPLIFRYELTSDQDGEYRESQIGQWGVGDKSFPYDDCCLNVLDIAYIRSITAVRRQLVQSCAVNTVRAHSQKNDGLRYTIPMDDKYEFPQLELRPECGGTGRWFDENVSGLNCDIYNPLYFADVEKGLELTGVCNDVAELIPARECFKP
ncbi:MAG: hypothetical protein JSW58_01580, partial [Candidatus Latescibacterota bacterium]